MVRMKTTRAAKRTAKRALAVLCAATIAAFAFAGSAFAATVHGADFHGTGSALESGQIDVLNVDGSAGETVFLSVMAGSQTIAKNLPYTIGENADGGEGSWNGVATLDIEGLDLNALDGTYTIEAYESRAGGDALYSGALYGVYADLPDGTQKLIGTRTISADEAAARTFEPAETLYTGGRTYRLAGESEASTADVLHFAYEEYDEATTVDGVVKYTNAAGETVASTKIPGLAYGEQRKVEIPAVVVADNGDMYRTVYFQDSVVAENPGHTSFSVYCAQMSEADKTLAGFYVATIKMIDEYGNVIATDSVDVTGEFIYTAPTNIYKTEVVDAETGQTAVVTYDIDQTPTIRLSAARDGVVNRVRTITVSYVAQPLDAAEIAVTFNLLDGSKRVNEKGRVLGTTKLVANAETPTVQPEPQIEVGGAPYYLVGDPSDYAYTIHSGLVPTVDAFYVPEGYQPPGAYDVTVNYVNFLTGATIESHSYTSNPDERISIETPATFSADGIDYIRLDGQENAIAHSYYSGIAAYTVYYRDKNDTLSAGTVINTIRVVYADGEEAGGDVTVGDGTAVAGDADGDGVADDATALQLNAGRTYNVFDGEGNNGSLTNESGVNSNTERIEDSETPLASGFDRGGSSSAVSAFGQAAALMVPIGIVAALIILAAIAYFVMRRRKENEEYGL